MPLKSLKSQAFAFKINYHYAQCLYSRFAPKAVSEVFDVVLRNSNLSLRINHLSPQPFTELNYILEQETWQLLSWEHAAKTTQIRFIQDKRVCWLETVDWTRIKWVGRRIHNHWYWFNKSEPTFHSLSLLMFTS